MFASRTKTLLKSKRLLTFSGRTKESDTKVSCDYNNHSLQKSSFFFCFIPSLRDKKKCNLFFISVNLHHMASFSRPALCLILYVLSYMVSDDLDNLGVHKELIVLTLLWFFLMPCLL